MSSKKLNYNNIINSRSIHLKHPLKLSLLKEEEKFLIKKNRFANKVSITELDLTKKESILNKFNTKHNKNNEKIINQIKSISNKILENNSTEKKRKMLDELLFINRIKNKYNYLLQEDNNTKSDIKPRHLFLSPSPINKNIKNNKKEESFSILNYNPDDKMKKCFYIIKQNKNKEKEKEKNIDKNYYLPPINKFKYKYHKIKLKINNDKVQQDNEENMMKLYKELEFQKKYKFAI